MSELDTSLGAILIGTFLNIGLFGVLISQVTLYFIIYKSDYTWVKLMVGWLLLLDTLNSIFDAGFVYKYTIISFGNFGALAHSHWFFHLSPLMTVAVASTAQGFFAWRINRLTGWSWVSWGIGVILLVQFAAGLATTVGAFIVVDFARFEELRVTICLWLVSSAVADVAITGILTWYLHTHRTGFSRTDDLITRLIRVTVQTGLITTIWAVADLIIFLAVPNPLHLLFNLPLCKLYSNSLMSALNARGGWDENSNEETSIHGMSMPISVVDDKTGDNSQTSLPRKVQLSRRPELNWGGERDSFELTSYTKSPPADVERGEFSTPIVRINSNGDAGPNTAVELTLPAKARSSTGLDTTADEWSLRSPTALEKAECD